MSVAEKIRYTCEDFAADGRDFSPTNVTVLDDCGHPPRRLQYAHDWQGVDDAQPIPRGVNEGPPPARTIAAPTHAAVDDGSTTSTKTFQTRSPDAKDNAARRHELALALVSAAERTGITLSYAAARGIAFNLIPDAADNSVPVPFSRRGAAKRAPAVPECMKLTHAAEQARVSEAELREIYQRMDEREADANKARDDEAYKYAMAKINAGIPCSMDEARAAVEDQKVKYSRRRATEADARTYAMRRINRGEHTTWAEACAAVGYAG